MDSVEVLELEVSQLVDTMAVEVVLALMDKWERDMEMQARYAHSSVQNALDHYVRLKIAWHHIKRHMEWSHYSSKFDEKERYYSNVILKARRNYYVAKRRAE